MSRASIPSQNSLPERFRLGEIRTVIARLEGRAVAGGLANPAKYLPFGVDAIDAHLGGGLSAQALHEFSAHPIERDHAAAATRLLAALLAPWTNKHGPVLWVCARADLYPPGLASVGLDPARLIVAETAAAQIPAVMEEALRHSGLAAVVGETGTPLNLTLSRRLHLAAERAGRPAFLLRRFHTAHEPSAAVTRWRVGPVPAVPAQHRLAKLCLDPLHLQLDLMRCRGGTPASWTLTSHDHTETDSAHYLALPPALADRPAAPHPQPAAIGRLRA